MRSLASPTVSGQASTAASSNTEACWEKIVSCLRTRLRSTTSSTLALTTIPSRMKFEAAWLVSSGVVYYLLKVSACVRMRPRRLR